MLLQTGAPQARFTHPLDLHTPPRMGLAGKAGSHCTNPVFGGLPVCLVTKKHFGTSAKQKHEISKFKVLWIIDTAMFFALSISTRVRSLYIH